MCTHAALNVIFSLPLCTHLLFLFRLRFICEALFLSSAHIFVLLVMYIYTTSLGPTTGMFLCEGLFLLIAQPLVQASGVVMKNRAVSCRSVSAHHTSAPMTSCFCSSVNKLTLPLNTAFQRL